MVAAKGNKYAVGNKGGGRPKKYQNVEEVEKIINNYFANTKEEEWTMTGVAMALDIEFNTFLNYRVNQDFYEVIKKAYQKVHNAYEKDLRKKGRSGDIFALKNFGWKDKQEVENSGEIKINIIKFDDK